MRTAWTQIIFSPLTMYFWWDARENVDLRSHLYLSFHALEFNWMYIDQKLDWWKGDGKIERSRSEYLAHVPKFQRYTSIITPKWWNFCTCLVACVWVYLCWISRSIISTFKWNEVKSKRRNTMWNTLWYCSIWNWLQLVINIFHFCILFGAAKFNPISNGLCAQDEMQCNALALEVKVCTAAICIDCPRHPIRVTRDDDHTLDNHRFNAIHIRARVFRWRIRNAKAEKKSFALLK